VGMRAVPRFCIELCPGIYLKTEENHGKCSVRAAESAWQFTAEHHSFGRLGYRLPVAATCLLAPVALGLHFERRDQPSARVNICRIAELRGSPRQLTLSRNSQLGFLVWSAKKKNAQILVNMPVTKVPFLMERSLLLFSKGPTKPIL